MKPLFAGRRRARVTIAATLESALPGIRFRVTATATVRYAVMNDHSPRRLGEHDLARARQALRGHFARALKDRNPGDTEAARDALWCSGTPGGEELGLLIAVADINVDLEGRARLALADYDAAAQARKQRGDFLSAQVDVVRAILADPKMALAWLVRQEPARLGSLNIDQVTSLLDTIAHALAPDEPQESATLDDRLLDLVREFLQPFLRPEHRAALIHSLVAMFRAHGAHDLVAQAEEELFPVSARSNGDESRNAAISRGTPAPEGSNGRLGEDR